jgi:hypothetical protein
VAGHNWALPSLKHIFSHSKHSILKNMQGITKDMSMNWFLPLHLFHGLKGVLPQNDRDRCGGDHANFSDHHGDECAWCHIIHKVEQLQRDGEGRSVGKKEG